MMISADDIQAFEDANKEAMDAAHEFERRAETGIPPDRWASTQQMELVARGIKAFRAIIALQNDAILNMAEDMQQKGNDAMRLFADHSKYNQRE